MTRGHEIWWNLIREATYWRMAVPAMLNHTDWWEVMRHLYVCHDREYPVLESKIGPYLSVPTGWGEMRVYCRSEYA